MKEPMFSLKKLNNINYYLLIIFMFLIAISTFIYYGLFNINFNFRVNIFLWMLIPFEMFIYIYNLINTKKIDKFDILIFIMLLFDIISVICSKNIMISIFGAKNRYEGIITLVSYYLLFLNSRNKYFNEKGNSILKIMVIFGIINFVYSFLQVYIRFDFIVSNKTYVDYRASGLFLHPNNLGSFLVLIILPTIGMLFLNDDKKNRKLFFIILLLLYITLILTQCTSAYFGFIFGLICLILSFKIENKISDLQIFSTIIAIGLVLVCLTNFNIKYCSAVFNDKIDKDYLITGDISDTFYRLISLFDKNNYIYDTENGSNNMEQFVQEIDTYASNRIWIWRKSLVLAKDNLLVGVGLDNFENEFEKIDDKYPTVVFDKAHNEYIQILVTQGIFKLITYLIFIIMVVLEGIQSGNKLRWCLTFGVVGYLFQALSSISLIEVTPFLFIIMGMVTSSYNNDKSINKSA